MVEKNLENRLKDAYRAGGIPEERLERNVSAFASLAFNCRPSEVAEIIPFSR